MIFFRTFIFFGFAFCASSALASQILNIAPITQPAPAWCWVASSEMVLKHFGYPTISPQNNYQCGVVSSIGGVCWTNCAACLTGAGSTRNLAPILTNYAKVAQQLRGFRPPFPLNSNHTGILNQADIKQNIDRNRPIIAGISASGITYPPGSGFSQHIVVIVGYDDAGGNFRLVVNDPYPYLTHTNPYLKVGSQVIQPGRYFVPYGPFVQQLGYQNSIVFQ